VYKAILSDPNSSLYAPIDRRVFPKVLK
jgi:hypothetical protein